MLRMRYQYIYLFQNAFFRASDEDKTLEAILGLNSISKQRQVDMHRKPDALAEMRYCHLVVKNLLNEAIEMKQEKCMLTRPLIKPL